MIVGYARVSTLNKIQTYKFDALKKGGSDNDANMDYHNNSVGHSIGSSYSTAGAYIIADRVCDKLEAGQLKILEDEDDPNSSLINSHSCMCN